VILKEIVDISVGYPFRGKILEQSGSGTHVIQMKDIALENSLIDWGRVTETELTGKKKPYFLKVGDVLVAARGNHNYAVTIGAMAEHFNAVASPHFYVLSDFYGKLQPEYLKWFINSGPSQRYFKKEAEGSVAKSIRRPVLENLPIPVPSMEKQEVVVSMIVAMLDEEMKLRLLSHNNKLMMNLIAKDLIKESTQEIQQND